MLDTKYRAVFLDRDGTINIEKEYLYKIEDFEYLPGAVEGMRVLSQMGFLLVVITNQSGIARGYYTEKDYQALDIWMKTDLRNKGIEISGSYYCPHLSDGCVTEYAMDCDCRKPKTGLFWQAADDLNIDMNSSYAIGDKPRDLSICNESGVRGILLGDTEDNGNVIKRCRDWESIVQTIKAWEGTDRANELERIS